MKETIATGAHRFWVEGDVARITLQGLVTLSELSALIQQLERCMNEQGVRYAVYDARRILPIEHTVRKWAAKEFKGSALRGNLVVGANPVVRLMVTGMLAVGAALGRAPTARVYLVKNEAEAFSWIEEDRRKHLRGG